MAAVDTASNSVVEPGAIVISEGVSISQDELKTIMAVNKDWPYPAECDGWMMSHNAIRLDMADLAEALEALEKQAQKSPLEAWQVANLQTYFPIFYQLIHDHHDHEEQIFFPWMSARFKLPPKLSADHKTLMAQLDKVRDQVKGLKATGDAGKDAVAVAEIKASFSTLRSLMLEHLKEEDEVGLPAMRKFFTRKEEAPIEAKVIKTITPQGMANFLRPLKDEAAKRKWMTETGGIPGIVQSLVLLPATRKYETQVQRLVTELKKGERMPPEPGCFGC